MKKFIALTAAALIAVSLAACAKKTEETPAETTEQTAGMPNPWSDADSAQAAAEGAEVGYFEVPEDGAETSGGPVHWDEYRYMEHLAEARGGIGTAELIVRKGLKQESDDESGDYNEYKYSWTQEAGDWTVNCWGNEEGKMMKATWLSDNFSYSITVRGSGDLHDTYGIDSDAVKTLVNAIQ
ncbi:MAG: hypothetical protein IKE28_09040 [Solobacterium sp.]|nr:hypothetical protein [Solobacterium sp.]